MPPRSLVLVALIACDRLATEQPPESGAPRNDSAQCVRDADCVLLPNALTCCIECPPAPPYGAAPAWVLDGMLIENETTCAERWRCPAIECETVPDGCVARAACTEGRCRVVASGCEPSTS